MMISCSQIFVLTMEIAGVSETLKIQLMFIVAITKKYGKHDVYLL
jgi:hypothetical protein